MTRENNSGKFRNYFRNILDTSGRVPYITYMDVTHASETNDHTGR